ncbi:hypothetical protein [Paenibacillus sp. BIHB 4019]|uniref:hypothetical protein n=1 Tax=Paenibacillus sp. BIHB 4019 TaxID=1870819 RepID=UPI001237718A|nr:hypothetical protein [Paenibacillus sp. BIHB 4019]
MKKVRLGGHSRRYFNRITGYRIGCGLRSRYCAIRSHFDEKMRAIAAFLSACGLKSAQKPK